MSRVTSGKTFTMSVVVFHVFVLGAMLKTQAASISSPGFWSWASTPPMGWNSWDCYGPTMTEAEVKANADYMAEHLRSHGWQYVVVDIRWFVENTKAHGYNQTDPRYVMDEYGYRCLRAADGAEHFARGDPAGGRRTRQDARQSLTHQR